MKKKILVTVLAVIATVCLCFGFAGCRLFGGKNKKPNNGNNSNNGGIQTENPADNYTQEQIETMLADFKWAYQNDKKIYISGLLDESKTQIDIPDCVSYIWGEAFSKCTMLENVIIPNSVMGIGSRAFYNCTSLTSVSI